MHYRAYFLTNDGHIRDATDLDCFDDGDAGKQVADMLGSRDIEVWQGTRKVLLLRSKRRELSLTASTFSYAAQ